MPKFKTLLLISSAMIMGACSGSSPRGASDDFDGRASRPKKLSEAAQCEDPSDIRGVGYGDSYQDALAMAQREVSSQIQSTVSAKSRARTSQAVDGDGNEIIRSSFDVESQVLTRLENAQDVKVVSSSESDDQTRVVACMSRSDAAKPFIQKSSMLLDSLMLVSRGYAGTQNPMQKKVAYDDSRALYIRYVANRNILEGLVGEQKLVDEADAYYGDVRESYASFLEGYAIHLEKPEGDLEQGVFSAISQNYNIAGGECKSGLLLKVGSRNLNCKDGGLGIKCSVTLTLSGTSCEGAAYFDLQADVAGTGKYDQSEAMEKLDKNIRKADWIESWRNELNRWSLK